ncbi:MAG: choice-of-anchor K domain-containing protein, partial [Gammaproteobacteria bacterium]|nr:choice-of-anchor K domain-containing protein [Gammaproteobacteria bacterium]
MAQSEINLRALHDNGSPARRLSIVRRTAMMKKLFIILAVSILASVAMVPAGNAWAAEITFVSVVGSWRDPVDTVPGSQPGDPVIVNGDPIASISWGTTTGPQSGYDFIATLPPPFTLPGPIPYFSLGTFQHRNFVVGEPWLVSAELDVVLVLAVDGVPTGPLNFTFTLNHDETPNNLDPCPYPTPPGEGCTDRVTIVASADPTTFNVDGVDYTLEMSFLDNGSPVDEFITREGDTVNSSGLVGEFTLPPGLTVTKAGPATMRLAEWGDFVIGAQNASESDAYNVTLVDRLPDGPTGGMCDTTPEIQSAQVFEADGVTPVPGKGPLVQGTDYSFTYDGATCELTFTTLTDASVIAVGERLMIAYRTQLDLDSQDGITLTNVAGATQWFNSDASTEYRRTLSDGTVGVGDHEDAHNVIVDLPMLRFEKTVINVTSGDDPASVATPGDTLRYRLYVENLSDVTIDNFWIVDELDSLNADASFQAGTLNIVTIPAGADAGNTDANGGAAGTGRLDVRNLSIGGLGESVLIEFDVSLAPVLANGSYVYNQSQLVDSGLSIALSDDPYVNGQADPTVPDDDDPTQILIESAPAFDVDKVSSY